MRGGGVLRSSPLRGSKNSKKFEAKREGPGGILLWGVPAPSPAPKPSLSNAPVDVLQPDDVLLVELAEGDLQYPYLPFTGRGEPVHRLPRDEKLLSDLGLEDIFAELYPSPLVQNDPELVAVMVVLAGELAARGDGDDLDRAGEVVGVLLEPASGLIHLYGRRTVIQDDPLSLTASLAHLWWEPKGVATLIHPTAWRGSSRRFGCGVLVMVILHFGWLFEGLLGVCGP